jgi:hypothetical protein
MSKVTIYSAIKSTYKKLRDKYFNEHTPDLWRNFYNMVILTLVSLWVVFPVCSWQLQLLIIQPDTYWLPCDVTRAPYSKVNSSLKAVNKDFVNTNLENLLTPAMLMVRLTNILKTFWTKPRNRPDYERPAVTETETETVTETKTVKPPESVKEPVMASARGVPDHLSDIKDMFKSISPENYGRPYSYLNQQPPDGSVGKIIDAITKWFAEIQLSVWKNNREHIKNILGVVHKLSGPDDVFRQDGSMVGFLYDPTKNHASDKFIHSCRYMVTWLMPLIISCMLLYIIFGTVYYTAVSAFSRHSLLLLPFLYGIPVLIYNWIIQIGWFICYILFSGFIKKKDQTGYTQLINNLNRYGAFNIFITVSIICFLLGSTLEKIEQLPH